MDGAVDPQSGMTLEQCGAEAVRLEHFASWELDDRQAERMHALAGEWRERASALEARNRLP